jgi:Mg/Co/Ni transporter MgtE
MTATPIYLQGGQNMPLQTGRFLFDNGGALLGVVQITTGTFTVNSGTAVTVVQPAVTASSQIDITLKTAGGTVAAPFVTTITPGTGFTVNSGASDTSVYNYSVTG